jgi:hypothetical protein
MSSQNLFRWSGLAVILGGVLLPVHWILEFVTISSGITLSDTLGFIATTLLMFGIMGIYCYQIEETRILGFLGFVLTIISNCVSLAQSWLPERGQLIGVPGVLGPLTGFTLLPGFLLLGIGSWQANKFPRWAALLWVIGAAFIVPGYPLSTMGGSVLGYVLVVIGGTVLGVGLIGAGIKLWSGTVEPAQKLEAAT